MSQVSVQVSTGLSCDVYYEQLRALQLLALYTKRDKEGTFLTKYSHGGHCFKALAHP